MTYVQFEGRWTHIGHVIATLKARWPYHVDFHHYVKRLREGKAPRPDDVPNSGSWLKHRTKTGGVRTFGFKTAEEADAFKAQWETAK